MNKRISALVLAAFLLATAAPPVSLKVLPKVSLQWRQDVRLQARIDPHKDNLMIRLIIDGPKYASQDLPVEGEDGPQIIERWFKQVPSGHYEARAVILRRFDKQYVAKDTFCISGPDTDCIADKLRVER